jgi:L-ascorbate metabolism protein UlaG (beta-lactamase superfamily)
VTFIGTATLLIRYAGFTLLTDPNFVHMHEQVDIGYGLKATRQTDPAMEIADLPPLDAVVLSHFHGDHFDQVAERELDRAVPILTTGDAAESLRERGFTDARALATWESETLSRDGAQLTVTATPGRHGPPIVSIALPNVMGTILDFEPVGGRRQRVYITGDTLVIDDLREIPERFPDIDLAFLHLGGTRVLGIMVTMNAEQGIETIQLVKPRLAVPIHYDDYDVFEEPLSVFRDAVAAAGLEDRVRYVDRGSSIALPA